MSQDPFSPHDDVSGVFSSFFFSSHPSDSSPQDGFGPFSDPTGGTVSDSFTFSSSFSDEDSSFESFGDFGDFQTAEDGELTPTSGSWTFANEGGGSVDSSGSGGGGSKVEGGSTSSSASSR